VTVCAQIYTLRPYESKDKTSAFKQMSQSYDFKYNLVDNERKFHVRCVVVGVQCVACVC
jgi:hypothetical protein